MTGDRKASLGCQPEADSTGKTGRAVQADCGASGGVSVTKGSRSAWQAWQRQDQTRQAHMMLCTQAKAGQVAVWTLLSLRLVGKVLDRLS